MSEPQKQPLAYTKDPKPSGQKWIITYLTYLNVNWVNNSSVQTYYRQAVRTFDADLRTEQVAAVLLEAGFVDLERPGGVWVMPGAILSIERGR